MERTPTTRQAAECSLCGRLRECFIASDDGSIMTAYTICRACWQDMEESPYRGMIVSTKPRSYVSSTSYP